MSLKPEPIGPVPEETARLAKAVFPEGCTFIKMRDELGTLFQDEMFAALFPKEGQPALAPWRLALVTIMQFGSWVIRSPSGSCRACLSELEVCTGPRVRRSRL